MDSGGDIQRHVADSSRRMLRLHVGLVLRPRLAGFSEALSTPLNQFPTLYWAAVGRCLKQVRG